MRPSDKQQTAKLMDLMQPQDDELEVSTFIRGNGMVQVKDLLSDLQQQPRSFIAQGKQEPACLTAMEHALILNRITSDFDSTMLHGAKTVQGSPLKEIEKSQASPSVHGPPTEAEMQFARRLILDNFNYDIDYLKNESQNFETPAMPQTPEEGGSVKSFTIDGSIND
mmetsp:Transcript_17040/g.26323  ORF Transcript_17040/g.26323 Transcript_17040/m.26323 type:complete len:167 (+) Transcript_17040:821-1321(+)|eukprot:CAMPEP_0170505066 /NCGR_PEP_ID=MMETSP0208-20121228/49727_1 /TAXON_ID=197538 /ORGANISM="Strombidium inclinatum, Strain S3" /LENGTH=166 /DNA_ID=CAMNT_0010785681 /DNA_START=748 /DNA_END=1248 /DNA_ORIENTATION=-